MENKQKIVFKCKLSKVLYLIFLVCIPLKFYGQDFEWVYSTKGIVNQNDYIPDARVLKIITNSNNDVYIVGSSFGYVDFGDGLFNPLFVSNGGNFVAKLNEDKEVIWIKF